MFEKWLKAVVGILPKPLQRLYAKYEDVILYVFFGGLTTVISLSSQFLAAAFLGKDGFFAITACTAISWICAVTFAFFTNKKYVFKSETHTKSDFWKQFLAFYGARGTTFFLELAIMWLFVDVISWNYYVVKIAAQFVILAANYLFSKLVIFRKKTTAATEQ